MASAVDAVTLKIKVPSANALKTIRIETKTKVLSLRQKLAEKLEVTGIDFDAYGLSWESDSGETWLSDGSTLKAIGLKEGDSLVFKPRPITTKFSLLSSITNDPVQTEKKSKAAPSTWGPSKGAAWSSARPASFYGSKSPPSATPLSPKSMSTSTLGELKIATIVAMDELDDLIESFDDFCTDEPTEDSLISSPSVPRLNIQVSPRGEKTEQGSASSRARGITTGAAREPHKLAVSADIPATTFSSDHQDGLTPSVSDRKRIRSFTQNTSKVPAAAPKPQPDKLVMVEAILKDALNGIDMELELGLIRHYIESALAVINRE